jgi:hypothetical protein
MSDLPEITPEVAAVIRRYLENGGTWPPQPALATGIATTEPGTPPSAPTALRNVFGSLSGGHAMLPPREAVDERALAAQMQAYLDDVSAVQGPPDPFPLRMSAANYSLTDRIRYAIQDALMAVGAKPYEAGSLAGGLTGLVGITPVGVPMAADDVGRAMEREDIAGAGIAALGLLPAVGRLTKPARSIGRNVAPAAERTVEPISYGIKGTSADRVVLSSVDSPDHGLYSAPVKQPRPFEKDYTPEGWPGGLPADASGRLTHDIEGRRLVAPVITGRRVLGGADVAVSPAELNAVAKAGSGQGPQGVAPSRVPGGGIGAYTVERRPSGRLERNIFFDKSLSAKETPEAVAHEIGHMVEDLAGELAGYYDDIPLNVIPQTGLAPELRALYNDLNNPAIARIRARGREPDITTNAALRDFGPEQMGYSAEDAPRELFADAVRAYLTNPNYLKTMAPNVAARIREYANANPVISKFIQFNAIPAAVGVPLAVKQISGAAPDDSEF